MLRQRIVDRVSVVQHLREIAHVEARAADPPPRQARRLLGVEPAFQTIAALGRRDH